LRLATCQMCDKPYHMFCDECGGVYCEEHLKDHLCKVDGVCDPMIWGHIEDNKLICGYFWEDHPLMALSAVDADVENYIFDAVEVCEQSIEVDKSRSMTGQVCVIAPTT